MLSGESLKNLYKSFASQYPIVSIEDPFDQNAWVHYTKMTQEIRELVQIVGDDILVTIPTVSFSLHSRHQPNCKVFFFHKCTYDISLTWRIKLLCFQRSFRELPRLSKGRRAMHFC